MKNYLHEWKEILRTPTNTSTCITHPPAVTALQRAGRTTRPRTTHWQRNPRLPVTFQHVWPGIREEVRTGPDQSESVEPFLGHLSAPSSPHQQTPSRNSSLDSTPAVETAQRQRGQGSCRCSPQKDQDLEGLEALFPSDAG